MMSDKSGKGDDVNEWSYSFERPPPDHDGSQHILEELTTLPFEVFDDILERSPILPYELEDLNSTLESSWWDDHTDEGAHGSDQMFFTDTGLLTQNDNKKYSNDKPPPKRGRPKKSRSPIRRGNKDLPNRGPTRKSPRLRDPTYLARLAQLRSKKSSDKLQSKQDRFRKSNAMIQSGKKAEYYQIPTRKSQRLSNAAYVSKRTTLKNNQTDTNEQPHNDPRSSTSCPMIQNGDEKPYGEKDPVVESRMFRQPPFLTQYATQADNQDMIRFNQGDFSLSSGRIGLGVEESCYEAFVEKSSRIGQPASVTHENIPLKHKNSLQTDKVPSGKVKPKGQCQRKDSTSSVPSSYSNDLLPSACLSLLPTPTPNSSAKKLPGMENISCGTASNEGLFIGDLQYLRDSMQYLEDPYVVQMLAGVEPEDHINPNPLPTHLPYRAKIGSSASTLHPPTSLVEKGFQSTDWFEYPLNSPTETDMPLNDTAASDDTAGELNTSKKFESWFNDDEPLFSGECYRWPDAGNWFANNDE